MPYSTELTGSVGGLMLPQNLGSSTFSLVIAAPGILMFGPSSRSSSPTSARSRRRCRLDLLVVHHLVGKHGERRGLGIERLLDLDLEPALADQVEPDWRAVRRLFNTSPGFLPCA